MPEDNKNSGSIEWVPVSPEMTALMGGGSQAHVPMPEAAAMLVYSLGEAGGPAWLEVVADAGKHDFSCPADDESALRCVVARSALSRLFAWSPSEVDGERFHLTCEMRAIALAIVEAPITGPSRETYRIGKSIELLCETVPALRDKTLVPVVPEFGLSPADSRRIVAARRIIDERWSDKLTLDSLARASGLNRAKLTRGFRALYHCTVAEAIAERRLTSARHALRTTDLPVASIGYASGYLNNASFARAFGRRFGVSPSEYRGSSVAA